jgi:DNA gyrase/topoisomerase IV subunit A
MQLRFSPAEFQLLVDVVEESDEELRSTLEHSHDAEQQRVLSARLRQLQALEDKIIARDLQLMSDELELLAEIVNGAQRARAVELARTPEGRRQAALLNEGEALQHIHDKVVETCAMF